MRINFLFSRVFWGIVLIFFGIGVMLKIVLNIDIPLNQIFFSLLLIFIGIQIIFGGFRPWNFDHTIHSFHYNQSDNNNEFNISFGSGVIDLSDVSLSDGNADIRINTFFGGGCVVLNPDIPAQVKVTSTFGGATFPDGNSVSFGESYYKTPGFNKDNKFLNINVNIAFGGLRFVNSKDDIDKYCDWRKEWRHERRKWRHHHHRW